MAAGCGGRQRLAAGPAAVDPQAAVRAFLNAVKANSLQGMAELWGTDKGPASNTMDHQEMDKRLSVIRTFLVHDKFEFQVRNTIDAMGAEQRVLDVRLSRNGCQPVVPFTVVRYKSRWLVKDIDLSAAGNPVRSCAPPRPASSGT